MKYLGTICLALFTMMSFGQEKFTISGYVKDQSSGEELIGSSVLVKELATGAATNIYGFYSITIPKGKYTLVYSFIGYNPTTKEIDLTSNMTINMELGSNSEVLKEVEIKAERSDENVESISMSKVDMNIETIKKIPALMGEVDVIRAIQLLPGVQTAGEGSTGFFVRGGGVDQNLILLDEATVFNASHLMGFFSVFNQDAIKDAQLYKGGIPARYGGRLSSVLDVHMKEGNSKKLGVSGGIGLISSRLTVEAPIVKNKSSFIVSGRRTYADLFLGFSKNESLRKSKLFFYDLNGKANYIINDKNRIYLSGYFGRDILGVSDAFLLNWGNRTITGRWNHLFNEKLFSNFTA
ncbi:MAG: TonB-dependent receptor, partial [Flavobacteriales bacterium]|nr:TonB-dependent receptor [Flavobacteriales bacterium]